MVLRVRRPRPRKSTGRPRFVARAPSGLAHGPRAPRPAGRAERAQLLWSQPLWGAREQRAFHGGESVFHESDAMVRLQLNERQWPRVEAALGVRKRATPHRSRDSLVD